MKNGRRRQPVVVCGNGRSGTSCLAGVLVKLGVFMGYTFMPRNITNRRGAFEDMEFMGLNRELGQGNVTCKEWLSEMKPLLERRFERYDKTGQRWGWKCPVTTNFLGIYVDLLPDAQYLRIDRNKEDIFASCKRCYGWEEELSNKIYTIRIGEMDEFLKAPRDVHRITFEGLLSDPEKTIKGIAEWLDVPVTEEAINHIDKKEVHFTKGREDE